MVETSQQRRTVAVKTLAQQLNELTDDFARLAEQQAQQKQDRNRDEQALSGSLRKGLQRIHERITKLEETGGWRKQYFNLFDVIERTTAEHSHSNVLAWLLNPTEAHGLGDGFLRAFVKAVFDEELKDTRDVVVKREYKRSDIVIWRRAEWVLVIENKVHSTQRKNQLLTYARHFKSRRFHKRYFAFLTRNGEAPNCKDFISVSYRTVRRMLTNLHSNKASEFFIRHFVDNIWFA